MIKYMKETAIWSLTLMFAAATTSGQEPAPAPSPDSPAAAAPAVHFSTEEWDFGTKWYGEECSTEIIISNTGDAPLKILNIRSSCGCTAAKPKRNELGPGESDSIQITYNTKKDKEIVSQTITLQTNDPERPRVALRIKGVVKNVFDITPMPRITFGRVERNETATQTIELSNNMDEPVSLKLKTPPEDARFDVKLTEIEAGRKFTLSATTRPPLPLGSSALAVELDTGVERLPALTINISAYIAPRIYVRPVKLQVSPSVVREFKRTIRVYYNREHPIEIKEVQSSHPDLIKVETLPPRDAVNPKAATNYHELRVTLPPGDKMPPQGGEIKIVTDDADPEYQTFIIKVELFEPNARPIEEAPGTADEADDQEPSTD